MATHRIIGYGSLLNKASAERTVVCCAEPRPIRVYGWRRVFNIICDEDKDLKTMDKAVLNVVPDKDAFFNGVLLEIDEDDLERLKMRECEYTIVTVDVCCFRTNEKLGKAILFVGKPDRLTYFIHPDPDYYQLCREGAASFGEDFLKEWDETTFHACGKKVCELTALNVNS